MSTGVGLWVGITERLGPVIYCLKVPEKVQPSHGAGSGGGYWGSRTQSMAGEPPDEIRLLDDPRKGAAGANGISSIHLVLGSVISIQ